LYPEIVMRKLDDLIHRVRAEYLEVPGLRLKAEQVERLCGIERAICQRVLDSLVKLKFLGVKSDGRYTRIADSHHPAPAVGGGFVSESRNSASHVAGEHDIQVRRQPERRRYRSDAELRHERARLELQWNEQQLQSHDGASTECVR
jgi:hypothetical protein